MTIGIGVIGAGYFGGRHAQALTEIPEAYLVAACRTSPNALQEFVACHGGRGYQDHRDLLADPQVDAVVIATPHGRHADIASDAARAGKHILLEKPMACSLEGCDRIIAAASEAGVTLMVGHSFHFVRAYRKAKELLDSGEFGQVATGVATASKFWFEPNRQPWHLDRATGGGMLLTAGIHALDLLTWLVGSPVRSVCAQLDTRFHDQQADDAAVLFLRYANGTVGTVVSTAYRNGAPKHMVELTCTKGMINAQYELGVTVGHDERWQLLPDTGSTGSPNQVLVDEWRAFLKAVQTGCEPAVTGAYGRHIMATIFAAEESSRLQREVLVEPCPSDAEEREP